MRCWQVLLLSTLLLLVPTSLSAGIIYEPGTVVGAVLTDAGFTTTFFDVRGAGSLLVSPPGSTVSFFDTTGGADPTYSGLLPYGNSLMIGGLNGELVIASFDFNLAALLANMLFIPANVGPLTPITEPALQNMLAGSPLLFAFTYDHSVDLGGGAFMFLYNLTSVDYMTIIPEPATIGLVALALGIGAVLRRRLS